MSRLDRAAVWRWLGEPSEQIGSANEPRRGCDAGLAWNEKWILRGRQGRIEHVVLWDRYDLVAVFRVDEAGDWQPEPLPDAVPES